VRYSRFQIVTALALALCVAFITHSTASAFIAYGTWINPNATYRYSFLPSQFNTPTDAGANVWTNVTLTPWKFTKVSSNAQGRVTYGTIDSAGALAAVTTPTFDGNGRIIGFVIQYDQAETWYTGSSTPAGNQIDARSIAAHEFGHALGLHHSDHTGNFTYCPGNNTDATMCSVYGWGLTYARNLELDDKNGVRTLYP
jgi:hypothetical protein